MAKRTGRAKPMTAKAGVTKTKRRYAVIQDRVMFSKGNTYDLCVTKFTKYNSILL